MARRVLLALVAGMAGSCGPAERQPAAPAATVVTPPATATHEIDGGGEPAPGGDDAGSEPARGGAEPGSCEEYLALYARCEPKLQAEIAAGNRRSARAERAFIEHMKTTPEAANLDRACADLLRDLRPPCGP